MKKWSKPEISNLCVQLTNEFEIEPLKSDNSCDKSSTQAVANKGKGCSVTECPYYKKNNEGEGKGGKCGGVNGFIS